MRERMFLAQKQPEQKRKRHEAIIATAVVKGEPVRAQLCLMAFLCTTASETPFIYSCREVLKEGERKEKLTDMDFIKAILRTLVRNLRYNYSTA